MPKTLITLLNSLIKEKGNDTPRATTRSSADHGLLSTSKANVRGGQ